MDKDLEEQINNLTEKFKVKITKLVQQATSKALKEQAKSFKEEIKLTTKNQKPQKNVKKTNRNGYISDDSD
jgi:hypothetical protein